MRSLVHICCTHFTFYFSFYLSSFARFTTANRIVNCFCSNDEYFVAFFYLLKSVQTECSKPLMLAERDFLKLTGLTITLTAKVAHISRGCTFLYSVFFSFFGFNRVRKRKKKW